MSNHIFRCPACERDTVHEQQPRPRNIHHGNPDWYGTTFWKCTRCRKIRRIYATELPELIKEAS